MSEDLEDAVVDSFPDIYASTTKNILAFSGGKDSVATCLHMIELEIDFIMVFGDTGNEHPVTIEYVKNFHKQVGKDPVIIVKADFSEQIAKKRMFIARDRRVKKRRSVKRDSEGKKISVKVSRVRYTNKAKRRILDNLHPSGNPFLDLCMWKGRFPSRMAQFCTQELKVFPAIQQEYFKWIDKGYNVVAWQGIRAEESLKRANMPISEEVGGGLWSYRPIHKWLVKDLFDIMNRHGVKPNDLYKKGFSRVGCMPCINCTKSEVFEMSRRYPEEVERISQWERKVALVSKRGAGSFFAVGKTGKDQISNIHQVVSWGKTTKRGSKNTDLFAEFEEIPVCSSAYGLCE